MTESQLRDILKLIDAALDVYDRQGGKLNAMEISVKSMLATVRMRLQDQLEREFCGQDE